MPDISTPNLDYGNMVQAWDINDALMGGTLYMRQLGEAYMPRWPKEDKEDYIKRLEVSTLLPAYEETINQNVGRVFAEPVQLGEKVPDRLREYAKDIDMEGTRLDVWAQSFFALAMQYGLSHALVDYPRVDAEQVRTKADEKATGARPYVTMEVEDGWRKSSFDCAADQRGSDRRRRRFWAEESRANPVSHAWEGANISQSDRGRRSG